MTLGASTMAAAATATTTPPAVATKRRRGVAGLRLILSGFDRPDGNGAGSSEYPGSSVSGAVLSIECSSPAPDRNRVTLYDKVGHYSPFPCQKNPVKPLDGALTLSFELALLTPPRAAGRHPRPRGPRR